VKLRVAGVFMTYFAELTIELVRPPEYAIAVIVSLVVTLTGVEYSVPVVLVGVLPSIV